MDLVKLDLEAMESATDKPDMESVDKDLAMVSALVMAMEDMELVVKELALDMEFVVKESVLDMAMEVMVSAMVMELALVVGMVTLDME